MKVGLIALLAFVILGACVGTLIVRDPGYVLIAYGDMAWETSVWFALAVFIVIYLTVRLLFALVSRLTNGFGGLARWAQERKARAARKKTAQGLLLWAEGDWHGSRRLLADAAPSVEFPLVNYLHAAQAANEVGEEAQRDELIRLAEESTPGSRFAVGLTHAELLLKAGRFDQSLARLLTLRGEAPRHPLVNRLLLACYEALGDWEALLEALPDAESSRAMSSDALEELSQKAWRAHLAEAPAESAWNNLPKSLRKQSDIAAIYAEALIDDGRDDDAERVVKQALKSEWATPLVALYGEIGAAKSKDQLATAEQWLRKHPNDATLLLTLGRLSMRNEAWAKAREYFENSLRLEKSPQVYGELGRLCVSMGEVDRGSEYLIQAASELPELPLPAARGVVENVAG